MKEVAIFHPLEYAWEGIDGGGKTTTIRIISEYFQNSNICVEVLPGLSRSPLGQAIRRNIARLNDMGINGMKYFKEDIRRSYVSLNGNHPQTDLIFWDRHIYSMAAANSAGCDLGLIRRINPRVDEPARVFLLDIPPEIAWKREQVAQKGDHPLTPEWLLEKYQRYHQLATSEPDRFIVIDASRPLNQVVSQLLDIISEDLRQLGKL